MQVALARAPSRAVPLGSALSGGRVADQVSYGQLDFRFVSMVDLALLRGLHWEKRRRKRRKK